MQIIQDKTKTKNMELVYEMQKFFDDDSGELTDAMHNEKILFGIKICAMLMTVFGLISMIRLLFIGFIGTQVNLDQVKRLLIVVCISNVLALALKLYYKHQKKLIKNTGIFDKYGCVEMLIYWLFEEPEVTKITVSPDKKRIRLHKIHSSVNLDVKGFFIEGDGNEIAVVDLDNLVLKTI